MITLSLAAEKDLGPMVSASTDRSAEEGEQKSFRYSLVDEMSSSKTAAIKAILSAKGGVSSSAHSTLKESVPSAAKFPVAVEAPLFKNIDKSGNSSTGFGVEAQGGSQNKMSLHDHAGNQGAAKGTKVSARSIENRKVPLSTNGAIKKESSAIEVSIQPSTSKSKTKAASPVNGHSSAFISKHEAKQTALFQSVQTQMLNMQTQMLNMKSKALLD